MDRDLALNHLAAKLGLDITLHVDDGLPCHAIKDAAIVRRRDQLEISIARTLEHENIENGHLLDIVVKEP